MTEAGGSVAWPPFSCSCAKSFSFPKGLYDACYRMSVTQLKKCREKKKKKLSRSCTSWAGVTGESHQGWLWRRWKEMSEILGCPPVSEPDCYVLGFVHSVSSWQSALQQPIWSTPLYSAWIPEHTCNMLTCPSNARHLFYTRVSLIPLAWAATANWN